MKLDPETNESRPSPSPLLTLRVLLVAWSVSAAVVGLGTGLFEWWYEPERVPPFETLSTYILWRSLSAALATIVCGLVVYSFRRDRDDSSWLLMPGVLIAMPISRAHSVPEVLLVGVLMGLVITGVRRISSRAVDRRDPANEADGV